MDLLWHPQRLAMAFNSTQYGSRMLRREQIGLAGDGSPEVPWIAMTTKTERARRMRAALAILGARLFGSLVLTVVEEMLANSLRVNCCLVCDLLALLKQTRNAYCKLLAITGVF